jgi:hypothetical protein
MEFKAFFLNRNMLRNFVRKIYGHEGQKKKHFQLYKIIRPGC